MYFIATRYLRENPHLGRQSAAFPYALVFLSLLSVYLISCSGLPDRSGGGFGGPGDGGEGNSPSTASLVVQGTSGMTTVTRHRFHHRALDKEARQHHHDRQKK